MAALTQDMIELLAAGVSHQVGACTSAGRPVLCRALAAQPEEGGERIMVILSGESGFEVLAAIRENGRISFNATWPKTHQSLNLIGRDATVNAGGGRFRKLVDERHRSFREQLIPYGFPPDLTSAWYNIPDDDLMVIYFTPLMARNQTPGPGAGNVLALRT
jgi:hypothetical protein